MTEQCIPDEQPEDVSHSLGEVPELNVELTDRRHEAAKQVISVMDPRIFMQPFDQKLQRAISQRACAGRIVQVKRRK